MSELLHAKICKLLERNAEMSTADIARALGMARYWKAVEPVLSSMRAKKLIVRTKFGDSPANDIWIPTELVAKFLSNVLFAEGAK